MNANRALGLLAAILVTTGQAMVFAVDTAAVAQGTVESAGYKTSLDTSNIDDGQLAYAESRGLIGG